MSTPTPTDTLASTQQSSFNAYTRDIVAGKEMKTTSIILTQKNMNLRFIQGQRGKSLLCFNNFTYAKNNSCGNTTYWNCRSRRVGMKPCKARITTTKQPNGLFRVCLTKPEHNHEPSPHTSVAIYSATSRGRVQLIYGGQPFIFEKILKLSTGEEKKFWRCNQWWNQKCRSRVYTINDIVMPLNRYHTHEEIVRRKKRTRRVPMTNDIATTTSTKKEKKLTNTNAAATETDSANADTATDPIDVTDIGMHLKYEEIVADVTEIVESPTSNTVTKKCSKKS